MSKFTTTKITILLADNNSTTRAGICSLLAQADNIEIIAEAKDGFEIPALLKRIQPNILLLDLIMHGPQPSEIIKWVCELSPNTITLGLISSDDFDAKLALMLQIGITGLLRKDIPAKELEYSIRRVARGEILFNRAQLLRAKQWQNDIGEKIDSLTTTEINTLKLLAKGLENKSIASTLGVSPKTTAYHATHIFKKLSVKNRQEAAIWASKHLSDNLE